MAGKYDETNRGAIWKNEKKETEKHPDFTGSLNVDGKDYWVSAWKRRPDAGERAPALSFSVKPKDGKPMVAKREEAPQQRRGSMKDYADDGRGAFGSPGKGMDDEIPF